MQILLIRDVDTISMGRSILSFRCNRSTFVNYHRDECISLFSLFLQTVIADPDKEQPKRHFIWDSLFVKVSVFFNTRRDCLQP